MSKQLRKYFTDEQVILIKKSRLAILCKCLKLKEEDSLNY